MAQPQYEGGILRVASASSVAEAARLSAKEKIAAPSVPTSRLFAYLMRIWEQNRSYKEQGGGIQEQILSNLRARNNQYDPDKLSEIKAAGMPDVYMGLTSVKCAHAESWLLDIYSSTASDRTWGLRPTPVPDPPPSLIEQVKQSVVAKLEANLNSSEEAIQPDQFASMVAEEMATVDDAFEKEILSRTISMERKIHDQMVEGGWHKEFEMFISDVVTSKAGILKGPIVKQEKIIVYDVDPESGTVTQNAKTIERPRYWRVSPLDLYPSPTAETVNDGSLVEKVSFKRADLSALRDFPGYDKVAIERLLENFSTNTLDLNVTQRDEREDVENKDSDKVDPAFREDVEGLEFWCPVQGKTLIEYGLEKLAGINKTTIEPLGEYEINAIVVGKEVIYTALNDDPVGNRPYSKTGWRKIPGSFWYLGVPELMSDLQRVINASMRSLCYNMSMAAGPQAEIDTNRLVPGESLTSAFPGKVWQTINPGNVAAPAVRFFQPDSNANELLAIYDRFASLADDYTGIPAYSYGNDQVAGAGRTSSGLSMLMGAAAKGIKRVILAIDMDIFKTVVRRQFDWNMKYIPDPSIHGDVEVVTTGAVAIMVKEQMSERRMQFLNLTNNEEDKKLIGLEGRAVILREAAASLELPNQQIVKDPEAVEMLAKQDSEAVQMAQQQAMAAQQQAAELQSANISLQVENLKLETEVKKVQLTIEQQKLMLEQEKLRMQAEVDRAKVELELRKLQLEAQKFAVTAAEKESKDERDDENQRLAQVKMSLDAAEREGKEEREDRAQEIDAADKAVNQLVQMSKAEGESAEEEPGEPEEETKPEAPAPRQGTEEDMELL
jgi:hypothetical protein